MFRSIENRYASFYKPHIPDEHGEGGSPQVPSLQLPVLLASPPETAKVDMTLSRSLLPHSQTTLSFDERIKASNFFPHFLQTYS